MFLANTDLDMSLYFGTFDSPGNVKTVPKQIYMSILVYMSLCLYEFMCTILKDAEELLT